MTKERRQSARRFNAGLIVSFILLSLTLAGLVWRGAQTASMALEAHTFCEDNTTLPHRVTSLEEQTKKFNLNADKLIEVGVVQSMIRADQKEMKDDIGKILNAVNRIRIEHK